MSRSFPLSPQQRQLWHLQRQGGGPFRARCEVLIEGPLDPRLLRAALEDRVRRHEVLGCALRPGPSGEPVAEVAAEGARVSWGGAGGGEAGLTAELRSLDPARHVLVLEAPSHAADVAALEALVRETARALDALAAGAAVEEVPVQYGVLAEWQNQLLQTEDAALGRQFWARQDLSALMARLPREAPLQPGQPFAPAAVPVVLPPSFGSAARALGASPAELLQACWQVLLWRLAGGAEVVVGTAFDGRPYPEVEQAVGPFARDLPIRLALDARTPFSTALRRLRAALDEAREWQELFTWDQLQTAVGGEGSLFFPFGFDLHTLPPPFAAAGLRFRSTAAAGLPDRSRIRLRGWLSEEGPDVEVLYDAGVLSAADAGRLAGQLSTLASAALADPEREVGSLPLAGPEERALLARLSGAPAPPADEDLLRAFEEQASRRPEGAAVLAAGGELSYGALNARANQIARHLRSRGVSPGDLVAAYLGRDAGMPAAILGILKAGAAYLPLDPAYPEERLAFMLRASGARWVLAGREVPPALLPEGAGLISLLREGDALAGQPREDLGLSIDPGAPAYVMYTSGSTGTPRGVVIGRGCVAHYARALQSRLGLGPEDRFLHTASVAFSSSVRQLVVPLSHGAAVVVATEEQRTDPEALFREIHDRGVTVADLVPSLWRGALRALEALAPEARQALQNNPLLDNRLRLVLSASEPLLSDLPAAWSAALGGRARFINMYGQTETTGIVATFPVPVEEARAAGGVVPVGRPLPGTALYLLDRRGEPVPLGLAGEICIAGPGVGQGYLGRPADTAERFVPDALGGLPGGRLYRTGDLGRLREDGTVEFLGRGDHQMKVRGFRVEPGEVEVALVRHEAVREAAVVLHRDEATDLERLVAYVAVRGRLPEVEELRAFLGRTLPEYMVPAAFVPLPSLPRTATGKLDRKALPAPASAAAAGEAPTDPLERHLAAIWQEMLGVPVVGRHDNFFTLGGHSLLAIKVISRLRQEMRVELPFRIVFRTPTVAGLAEKVREAGAEVPGAADPGTGLGTIEKAADEVPAESLLAELDQMSDDQVSTLLAGMLDQEEQA